VAVRYALGASLRPLVVTNIYNDPVLCITKMNLAGKFEICQISLLATDSVILDHAFLQFFYSLKPETFLGEIG
jgi:hypothetical protein